MQNLSILFTPFSFKKMKTNNLIHNVRKKNIKINTFVRNLKIAYIFFQNIIFIEKNTKLVCKKKKKKLEER